MYARVSTKDKEQKPENQLIKLREYCKRQGYGIYDEYSEEISGMDKHRPEKDELMKDAMNHHFKKVIVTKIDRFGRSSIDLLNSIEILEKCGIDFVCVDQPIDTTTPMGKFLRTILSAVAELEREMIRDRVKDGLERAKQEGKKLGRPQIKVNVGEVKQLYDTMKSTRKVAAQFGISNATVSKLLKKPSLNLIEDKDKQNNLLEKQMIN